jgi:hypothetical protein
MQSTIIYNDRKNAVCSSHDREDIFLYLNEVSLVIFLTGRLFSSVKKSLQSSNFPSQIFRLIPRPRKKTFRHLGASGLMSTSWNFCSDQVNLGSSSSSSSSFLQQQIIVSLVQLHRLSWSRECCVSSFHDKISLTRWLIRYAPRFGEKIPKYFMPKLVQQTLHKGLVKIDFFSIFR